MTYTHREITILACIAGMLIGAFVTFTACTPSDLPTAETCYE